MPKHGTGREITPGCVIEHLGRRIKLLYYIEEGTWGDYWATDEGYSQNPLRGYFPAWRLSEARVLESEPCPLCGGGGERAYAVMGMLDTHPCHACEGTGRSDLDTQRNEP